MNIDTKITYLDLKELAVNENNFRHNPVIDEMQAMIELMKDDSFSNSLFDIAKSINEEGYWGQQVLSVFYSKEHNKYILLDGNRRITAIKISKDTHLIPNNFKTLKNKFLSLIPKKIKDLDSVPCFIYDDVNEAIKYLESIHISGNGPKKWERLQQLRFLEFYGTESDLSYAYKICKSYLTPEEIESSKNFSTVERVLKKDLFGAIFDEKNKEQELSEDEKKDIILKIINDTNTKNFNSRALNTKEDVKKYIIGELSIELANNDDTTGKDQTPPAKINIPNPQENVFVTLTYSMLKNDDDMENALIILCKELKDISKMSNFNKFKVAATCLTRIVLETSIKNWVSKKHKKIYDSLSNLPGKDPSLSTMINKINSLIRNGDDVFFDKQINELFLLTFDTRVSGKNLLDTVIHKPYLVSLSKEDLKINNNTNLFQIITHMLNYNGQVKI